MNKKEIGVLVYGFFMIGYFGLSMLSFWADPIISSVWYMDSSVIIVPLVVGFMAYAWYVMREPKQAVLN